MSKSFDLHFALSETGHKVTIDANTLFSFLDLPLTEKVFSDFQQYCEIVIGKNNDKRFDLTEDMFLTTSELKDLSFVQLTTEQFLTNIAKLFYKNQYAQRGY